MIAQNDPLPTSGGEAVELDQELGIFVDFWSGTTTVPQLDLGFRV